MEILNRKAHDAIQKYADEKGITYQEAAAKAYLVIDGKKIEPFQASDFNYDPNRPGREL